MLNDYLNILFLFHFPAVHLPLRSRPDAETLQSNYSTPMNNKINQRSDSVDMVSDGFDSDSKENENVSHLSTFAVREALEFSFS